MGDINCMIQRAIREGTGFYLSTCHQRIMSDNVQSRILPDFVEFDILLHRLRDANYSGT